MSELAGIEYRQVEACHAVQLPSPAKTSVAEASAELVSSEPPGVNVLVVKDHPGNVALIERCLMRMPQIEPQITIAGSLTAAQFAIAADDFDLIILDASVHGQGSRELMAQIADSIQVPPCILVADATDAAITTEARALGAAVVLAKKELSPRGLEAVVLRALREHALSVSARPLQQVRAVRHARTLTGDEQGSLRADQPAVWR